MDFTANYTTQSKIDSDTTGKEVKKIKIEEVDYLKALQTQELTKVLDALRRSVTR